MTPSTSRLVGRVESFLPLFRRSPEDKEASLAAARLASIVDSADDAIVSKTLEGIVLSWNPAAERIFGYSAEEMVGSSIYRLIPPELHDQEREILSRIRQGERIPHFETLRLKKDGTRFAISLTVSPVRDASGTIVAASSFKRDITEYKRATEAAARLAAIVQFSGDAIISKTLDGTILTWNVAAERMYGYSAQEVIGRSIYSVVPEELEREEREILEKVAGGTHFTHYETVRSRRDGSRIDISLTISPILDRDGKVVGASSIQRDITERKRTEAALRQASKMEAIGALAGGLAHDFNNQLHALSGFAHFVGRDPGLGAAGRQDLIEIQKIAERMSSLTRQLLAFARQQVLNPETLDLNTAVEDTRPMLQRLVGSNLEIQLQLAQGPKWIRVDRAQLTQILLNLVINARDAMPDGGRITIRTETLEVSPNQVFDRLDMPLEPGAYAELTVTDTGQGIRDEHLPHIFEPFYTTKEVGQGTGLGLATVEGIVSQSGGHIRLHSVVGRGTVVRVLLPLTAEPEPKPLDPSPDRPPMRRFARLLVVDDEDPVRAVIARILQAEGYEVLGARQGREALYYIDQVGGAVDAVVTDLVMPGMGGHELTEELSRRYPKIAVIWMSGHPREIESRHSRVEKAHAFLQKPVPPHILLQVVSQVLTHQRERRRSGEAKQRS